ncbi:MAG: alpha-1,2-fucosyltransferase [Selenomonadaceae bacterium]|nr:alpha-1,2-fucosyltransferase [Selenomonadaceae bacterium]
MIITKLYGGLGNQLFQYALGRCLAHKNNTELKFDTTYYAVNDSSHHNHYHLNVFNLKENFATEKEIKRAKLIKEEYTNFIPEILDSKDKTILDGYWQSWKYFTEIEDIIREELTLKNPLGERSVFWREKILSSECAVSLHIRRGDYLSPLNRKNFGAVPFNHYYTCLNELKKSCSNLTAFIFSDDLDWVKNNFKFDVPVEFVEGCEKNYEEIFLMSLCQHNIIPNSTFSWWGAWLNKNPAKKVFAPYPWFHNGNWKDICPEDWIKVPVDYDENPPYNPMLSIILYVKNNTQYLPITLQSIFSQSLKDYEVIILNSAIDDSYKYCQQFASNHNVTLIKLNHLTKKSMAFNKGIECTRGDYLLFLDVDDFILPNTNVDICRILTSIFNSVRNAPAKEFNYEDFVLKDAPDIFSYNMYLENSVNIPLTYNQITYENFSVKADEFPKNINGVASFDIDDRRKTILLVTQRINNFLGTKLFKRHFLNKYNICFADYLADETAIFKFIIDTFMCTEDIAFVSQPFYGKLI